ncbi:hypothetical protein DSY27_05610 [Lactobacillus helveticus]|nr:hypothetical protein DSY27_05610 [Lactobacillus helveticus]
MRNLPGKRHVYQHHIQIPEFKNWYKKSTTFSIKIYELLSPRHETILNITALTLCTGQIARVNWNEWFRQNYLTQILKELL